MKLIVIAPEVDFKNTPLDENILERVKSLNCGLIAVYLNPGWEKDEKISIKKLVKIKE